MGVKISALPEIDVVHDEDLIVIVDVSAGATKHVEAGYLFDPLFRWTAEGFEGGAATPLPTLYDPATAAWDDKGWITFEWDSSSAPGGVQIWWGSGGAHSGYFFFDEDGNQELRMYHPTTSGGLDMVTAANYAQMIFTGGTGQTDPVIALPAFDGALFGVYRDGTINAAGLPTSNPGVAGRLWVDAGVVKRSSG